MPFGTVGLMVGGQPYNPASPIKPDSAGNTMRVQGPAGANVPFTIPIDVCDDASPAYGSNDLFELELAGLPPGVNVAVRDESGSYIRRSRPSLITSGRAGLRFRPDCSKSYSLEILLDIDFSGDATFDVVGHISAADIANPYRNSSNERYVTPPPLALEVPSASTLARVLCVVLLAGVSARRLSLRRSRTQSSET